MASSGSSSRSAASASRSVPERWVLEVFTTRPPSDSISAATRSLSVATCTLWAPALSAQSSTRRTRARPAILTSGLFGSRVEARRAGIRIRSEEHTSELQSRGHLVCRLLLEKKKNTEVITEAEKRERQKIRG